MDSSINEKHCIYTLIKMKNLFDHISGLSEENKSAVDKIKAGKQSELLRLSFRIKVRPAEREDLEKSVNGMGPARVPGLSSDCPPLDLQNDYLIWRERLPPSHLKNASLLPPPQINYCCRQMFKQLFKLKSRHRSLSYISDPHGLAPAQFFQDSRASPPTFVHDCTVAGMHRTSASSARQPMAMGQLHHSTQRNMSLHRPKTKTTIPAKTSPLVPQRRSLSYIVDPRGLSPAQFFADERATPLGFVHDGKVVAVLQQLQQGKRKPVQQVPGGGKGGRKMEMRTMSGMAGMKK